MTDINTRFCRELLKLVHADVRKAFPEIPDLTAAASVTGPYSGARFWFVEIDTPGRPRFTWDDQADSATHARAEAWRAFMRKYAPEAPE